MSILWHTIVPANLLLARKRQSSQQHLSQHQRQLCTQVCLLSRLADNSWFSMLTLCPLKCHIHLPPCLPKLALEQRPQGHVPSWRLDGTDPYGRPLAASLRKTGRGRGSRPLAEPARHESRQNSSSDHFWRTWSWPASIGMGDAFVLTAWTFSHLPIRVQCDEEIEYNTLSFHDNKHTNVASKILLRKKCLFDLCRPTLHKTTERTTKM